jgi:hypothetical protein
MPSSTVNKQWCQHRWTTEETPFGNDKIQNSWCTPESKAHKNPNSDLGDTSGNSLSFLRTWNKDGHGFHLPSASAPPPPELYHSLGKGPVESRLAHWLDPSRCCDLAAPATLNPATRMCTSRRIGVVRHVRDGGEGWASGGGGAQIVEEEGGRGQGGCIFIRLGEFQTMEHLLVTRVRLPASPLSVGQVTIIFFI